MLKNAEVMTPIAVADLSRAATFYQDILGLERARKQPYRDRLVLRATTGQTIVLCAGEQATCEYKMIGFMVDNFEDVIDRLRGKGVALYDYNMPGFKTKDGIAFGPHGRCAWFSDPDGNILALAERMAECFSG